MRQGVRSPWQRRAGHGASRENGEEAGLARSPGRLPAVPGPSGPLLCCGLQFSAPLGGREGQGSRRSPWCPLRRPPPDSRVGFCHKWNGRLLLSLLGFRPQSAGTCSISGQRPWVRRFSWSHPRSAWGSPGPYGTLGKGARVPESSAPSTQGSPAGCGLALREPATGASPCQLPHSLSYLQTDRPTSPLSRPLPCWPGPWHSWMPAHTR